MALCKLNQRDMTPCDGLPTRLPGNPKTILMRMGKDWGMDSPFGGGK